MKFFHIPLLGMHIHHRRKASAVTGRETGFEEIHAFNRLIVERREKNRQYDSPDRQDYHRQEKGSHPNFHP